MNVAERQLREGLRDLAESVELDIDLVTVARQGRKLRRERRVRWSLGAVATLAAGLMIWPRIQTAPIPAIPEPAATPIAPSSPTTTEPAEPPVTFACEPADLGLLTLRPGQDGPATVAYGSTIIDAAEVDTGEGYRIVAVRLAEPTAPGPSDRAAWIRPDGGGWSAVVSDEWEGGGLPGGLILPLGPEMRTAALACLD